MASSSTNETDEHDHRQRGRAGVIKLLELGHDEHGDDLRFHRMLPEMKITEPYSPSARANASAKPVSSAGQNHRQDDARKTFCKRFAPRLAAASSTSGSRSSSTGCTVRTMNGRPMNVSATNTPSQRVGNFDSVAARASRPIQPFCAVKRRQRDARHGGRQRERQIHQRIHRRLPQNW